MRILVCLVVSLRVSSCLSVSLCISSRQSCHFEPLQPHLKRRYIESIPFTAAPRCHPRAPLPVSFPYPTSCLITWNVSVRAAFADFCSNRGRIERWTRCRVVLFVRLNPARLSPAPLPPVLLPVPPRAHTLFPTPANLVPTAAPWCCLRWDTAGICGGRACLDMLTMNRIPFLFGSKRRDAAPKGRSCRCRSRCAACSCERHSTRGSSRVERATADARP